MEQVGLGAVFMKGQVANVSTSYTGPTKETGKANERAFSKVLDKAKDVQSKNQDKNDSTPIKENESHEAVQKNKNEVKKEKSVSDEPVEVEVKDELESDKADKEIDENLLLLLSETLNVTTEQLKEVLNQMGYVVSDLLEQENFGKFISEIYSQIKGEDILTIETGPKNISLLFEQLQAINENNKVKNTVLPVQKLVHNEISTTHLESNTEELVQLPQDTYQTEEQIDRMTMENIPIQSTRQINKTQEAEESLKVLNDFVMSEADKVDTGIVVPIQNFSSTVYAQLWQPESEISVLHTPQVVETNIIDQIDFKILGTTKEIHLQLSPKELGELSIKLIEENSTIVAHIKVDSEKAKIFLLNQLNDLKAALEERGLTVVDVKVDINQDTRQSQMEQERQKSSKRIQEIISKHLETFEQEEEADSEKVSDSEVDYMV